LLNDNQLVANCQQYEPNKDLLSSESTISRQSAPDISGLLSSPVLMSLIATLPAKLTSLMVLRALKQRENQNQQVVIPGNGDGGNGDCGDGNGKGKGKGGNCNGGGNGGNGGNGGGNGGNDDDDDDEPRKTFMFFAGRGNIQVKNHNE